MLILLVFSTSFVDIKGGSWEFSALALGVQNQEARTRSGSTGWK